MRIKIYYCFRYCALAVNPNPKSNMLFIKFNWPTVKKFNKKEKIFDEMKPPKFRAGYYFG